eukprot:CCRYP_012845-RA/>CCRYP_012845-RA protein AED:0.17 eAED:0.17 QI:0/-1/0/1/-1/1/1/0/380
MNTYKSPIKKISHAGSKLASAAAHRGSQIIDQASSAVQTAVSSTTTLSPNIIIPRGQQDRDATTERPCRRSGAGIRDKIHKFDSVAASRRGKYNNESPMSSERTPHGVKYAASSFSRRHGRSVEKRREETESFPCNPNYRVVHDPLILRDRTENDKENARPIFQENTVKDASPPKTTPAKFGGKLDEEECELRKRLQRLEEENERLEKVNQRLVVKCEELTRENVRLDTSSNRDGNDCKDKKHSRSGERKHGKKRLSKEHPLISSPLRMHAMAVQEASESNSFVSVRKEPFRLFPPEHQSRCVSEADRSNGQERTHESCHLDTLGVLTCNIQSTADDFHARVRETDSISGNDCEKRENEDALDLLNSAAFLFKNSRRRLN